MESQYFSLDWLCCMVFMVCRQNLCKSCNGQRVLRGPKSVKLDIMPGISRLWRKVVTLWLFSMLFNQFSNFLDLANLKVPLGPSDWSVKSTTPSFCIYENEVKAEVIIPPSQNDSPIWLLTYFTGIKVCQPHAWT